MPTKPFFSSVRQTWVTPKDLYDALNKEFKFDFDPCPKDAKFDGLNHKWKNVNFVNPPFKTQKLWIENLGLNKLKNSLKIHNVLIDIIKFCVIKLFFQIVYDKLIR